MHGFKAHVGADANTALVEKVSVTPANVNDERAGPDALPDDPGDVFADSACRGPHFGTLFAPGAVWTCVDEVGRHLRVARRRKQVLVPE